jgi:hypothetical protein
MTVLMQTMWLYSCCSTTPGLRPLTELYRMLTAPVTSSRTPSCQPLSAFFCGHPVLLVYLSE